MLGFVYFTVSKHVLCPPLKMTSLAFFRASSRSRVDSHECMWQLPFFALMFLPGVPRLTMLFVSSSSSTGSMVWVSLARVPYGPLMGAKTCSAEPCVYVVSRKLPANSVFSFMPMLFRSPRLHSVMVYGGGLSGIIILRHVFTYRSTKRSPGLRKAENPKLGLIRLAM